MLNLVDRTTTPSSSPYRRSLRTAAAVLAVLVVSACSLQDGPDATTAGPPTAGTKQPVQSETTAIPAAVPESEVFAAVKAAQTATTFPDTINPRDLRKFVQGEPENMQEHGCEQGYSTTSVSDLAPCTVGAPAGAHTMVVVGDSNAEMWSGGLDLVGKRADWRIIFLTKNNCGPAALHYYLYPLERDYTECDEWQKWRTNEINTLKPAVVLLAGWAGGTTGPSRPMTADDWTTSLAQTIQQMPAGTKTVLLSNQPHIKKTAGECLAQHIDDISQCAEPASEIVATDALAIMQKAAAATNATVINVNPWFCDASCPQVIAGLVAYSSLYHITKDYAMYLSGSLADALQPVMT